MRWRSLEQPWFVLWVLLFFFSVLLVYQIGWDDGQGRGPGLTFTSFSNLTLTWFFLVQLGPLEFLWPRSRAGLFWSQVGKTATLVGMVSLAYGAGAMISGGGAQPASHWVPAAWTFSLYAAALLGPGSTTSYLPSLTIAGRPYPWAHSAIFLAICFSPWSAIATWATKLPLVGASILAGTVVLLVALSWGAGLFLACRTDQGPKTS